MKLVSLQKIVVLFIIPIALVLAIFSLAKMFVNIHTIELVSEGETTRLIYFENAPLILEEPTKKGHTFDSWFIDEAFLFKYNNSSPTSSLRLFAKFKVNQYSITFISYDDVLFHTIQGDYNSIFTLPEEPVREGYTFIGYDASIPETIIDENLILRSVWSINQYTIDFEVNGGTTIASLTEDYQTSLNAPIDPTRIGYTFGGWYIDNEYNTAYVFTSMPAEDLTVYARWLLNSYTIQFELNGGIGQNIITEKYQTSITNIPTKEGYRFDGWYRNEALTVLYTLNTIIIQTEDITLYAKWSINQYTIDFEVNGGTTIASLTEDYQTSLNAPIDPTRIGYTFGGWYIDNEYNTAYVFTSMPAEDLTVYARWITNPEGLDSVIGYFPVFQFLSFTKYVSVMKNVQDDTIKFRVKYNLLFSSNPGIYDYYITLVSLNNSVRYNVKATGNYDYTKGWELSFDFEFNTFLDEEYYFIFIETPRNIDNKNMQFHSIEVFK